MARPDGVRRYLIVLVALLVGALATPAGADAAKYKFKVKDFKLHQYVKWNLMYRDVDCESQSSADYYEHTGFGQAALGSNDYLRRGRVTFKTANGTFLPGRIDGKPFAERPDLRGAFAFRASESQWEVAFRDDPGEDCVPREELGKPDTSCEFEKRPYPEYEPDMSPGGILQMHLMFVQGRIRLTGGYYPFDIRRECSDPSVVSGTVSHAVPNKRGVAKLIRDKDVKKIRLKAYKEGHIGTDLLANPGASFENLAGGADYTAKWSMTLVRRR